MPTYACKVSVVATQVDNAATQVEDAASFRHAPGGPAFFAANRHQVEAALERAVVALFDQQPAADPIGWLARYLASRSEPTPVPLPQTSKTRRRLLLADMGNNVLDELRVVVASKELAAEELDWRLQLASDAVQLTLARSFEDDLCYATGASAITNMVHQVTQRTWPMLTLFCDDGAHASVGFSRAFDIHPLEALQRIYDSKHRLYATRLTTLSGDEVDEVAIERFVDPRLILLSNREHRVALPAGLCLSEFTAQLEEVDLQGCSHLSSVPSDWSRLNSLCVLSFQVLS